MAIWSPLTTNWAVNNVDSRPRTAKVDTIIHHHVAGTNKLSALALFAPGGREVTPNYFIAGREIWGIVPEDRRAFTSGSPTDDNRAITYEILNSSGSPSWGFSQETLDTVARLDADIARRYGVPLKHSQPGFMEHRNVYEWFGRGYATACAGPSFNIQNIIAATAAIHNGNQSNSGVGDTEMAYLITTDKGDILVVDHNQMTYWNIHEGVNSATVPKRIQWLKDQGAIREVQGHQPASLLNGYRHVGAVSAPSAGTVSVNEADVNKIAKAVNDDTARRMQS